MPGTARTRPGAAGRPGPRAGPAAAEIRALVAAAGPWLPGAVLVGLFQAVLIIAQAQVLARLLAGALYGDVTSRAAAAGSAAVATLALGQGLAGFAWETSTEAAVRRARAATRRRALAAALRLATPGRASPPDGQDGGLGPGGAATVLGPGIAELEPYVGAVLPRAVLALAVPALLLAWIARLDLVSAGLAAGVLTLGPVLAGLVGADTAADVRRRLTGLERLGGRFTALVQGLPLLRAYGRAGDHERAVVASGEELRAATLATLRVALLAGLVLELLAAVGTALVAVRLGIRLDDGQRILPRALAVLILTPEVFLPLRRLTAAFHAGAGGRAVLARVGELVAADPAPGRHGHAECSVAAAPASPRDPGGAAGPAGPVGVVLERVCLVADGSRPVLDGIDLRVRAGERLCLTGESGAGKTSLLRVMAGLARPTSGRARLETPDGRVAGDVRDAREPRDGRDAGDGRPLALGWVPQDPVVFAATVLENVALGRPGVDQAAAAAALRAALLGPWLASLPQALHTPLGGLGAPLSLGERRRLAVARCLAGPRPRLWLLDEPTAGLDAPGAGRLVDQIARTIGGATAVIATHDPLAGALADRVVELRHGRIAGPARAVAGPADAAGPELPGAAG